MQIKIKKLHPDAIIPKYQTEGAAGFDLHALIDHKEDYFYLYSGSRVLISTGLAFEIPKGYEMQIRPRSGIALKNGITVLNSPGTIDSDYRNEVGIILINTGNDMFVIKSGDRIAQGVLKQVERAEWEEVEELSNTKRQEGGFGSTGKN